MFDFMGIFWSWLQNNGLHYGGYSVSFFQVLVYGIVFFLIGYLLARIIKELSE